MLIPFSEGGRGHLAQNSYDLSVSKKIRRKEKIEQGIMLVIKVTDRYREGERRQEKHTKLERTEERRKGR